MLDVPVGHGAINDMHAVNKFFAALVDTELQIRKSLEKTTAIATSLEVYYIAKVDARSSRKIRSAVVRGDKTEMEIVFKKRQDECV